MRRSSRFLLSSLALSLVVALTMLAGGVTARSATPVAGDPVAAPGAVLSGTLCVEKFNDLDGDGKRGSGEPLLFGWVFTVTNAGGNVMATIIFDQARDCIDVSPGTYTITETPQTGWTPTTPGGASQSVTAVAGQVTTATFGNRQARPGTLCVTKFNDLDGDGRQGPAEATLFGWTFTVKDPVGVVATITTGDFAANCRDLPAGTYTVIETPQTGWTSTTPGGTTQTAIVVTGQTTTATFGNRQVQRICVVKFNDLDGNGRQDAGEPLVPNWQFIVADATGTPVGTLVSGTGRSCLDVKVGTWTVTETPQAGWTATTPGGAVQTVTVAAGQTVSVTFGNHRCCLTFTYLGGKIDNFSVANGATAEPVTPASITAAPRYFDTRSGDYGLFVHRFSLGAGSCIQSATLQMKIKALDGGSSNDTLGIRVPGSSAWARSISSVAPTGAWQQGAMKTLVFNLGAMPVGGGAASLIAALNASRVLDITVQDDTSVDYIRLVVTYCECGA